MDDIAEGLGRAVKHFWATRGKQQKRQGRSSGGSKDRGNRSAVTGGAQMDGFVELVRGILVSAGIGQEDISVGTRTTDLPGFFRSSKAWDLVVVVDGTLLTSIEFKSQVGPSFGNNFNNRTEEALGSATDLWTAYREGAFTGSPKPWLGYLMLLEEAPESLKEVQVYEPHFAVLPEFRGASYATRYELLCRKLIRERLYDAACLILSDRTEGRKGHYCEVDAEIGFQAFAAGLIGKATAFLKTR